MPDTTHRVEREARLRWVPIPKMRVSPVGQRALNQARVDRLAAEFDLEQLGTPTVNERDGLFYIIDGQHRIAALEQIGWGDQQVQCWTYSGLSEEEEADRFDRLNDVLAVHAFDKFRVRVTAGREIESDIDRIVRAQRLVVSRDAVPGAISAVGTLRRLCQRYNGELSEDEAIKKLGKVHGGVSGLLGKAELLRRQMGQPKGHCVAAAAVEFINTGRGGKKLSSWWKS
jgi:hypothetical protein